MTNLLAVLPDFDIKPYTHILPSLEKSAISTADLLTLDALDVAKRAQLPPAEVKKLSDALLKLLQFPGDPENSGSISIRETSGNYAIGGLGHFQHYQCVADRWKCISTLDVALDGALHGGIAAGYVTEITGERYARCSQHSTTC